MSFSMASSPTGSHALDLEAQQDVSRRLEVGGNGVHEASSPQRQSGTMSDSSQALLLSNNQAVTPDAKPEPQSAISHYKVGQEGSVTPTVNVKHNDVLGNLPTSTEVGEDEKKIERGHEIVTGAPPVNGGSPDDSSDPEPRMIGDFDGSANALWTLYGKEAKSNDEARIQTLKEDMDGVLIFAGLFSAILTAFIIDSKQSLKVSPQDQMVYYLQQNVATLDQISRQISTIVPQFSIPSTPPPAFPAFKPLTSDIVVNAFWFMALIFSLSAALLATLVQQWVRDYMHVFQRYSDPLKSARLRQYLHEGSEGWYMPIVAEAVPALLHVSLFLFLMGLCDFVLNINTAVGLSTTIPIAIISSLYILTTFTPILYPQSPYQNSFSGFIWYIRQSFGGRKFKDRDFNGASKYVNPDMAQGQMQLAMEETENRKGRDERAVRWLVSNMTEDAEMESFVMAIPGSFNGEWGTKVWKNVSNAIEDKNGPSRMQRIFLPLVRGRAASDSLTNTVGEDTVGELSSRVRHLLDTCKNPGLFATDELWRRRTRACIETTASLVCCVGAELGQFGDILKLLGDIGNDQTVRESSSVGKEQSFVTRWTCLSLVAIRPVLGSNWLLQNDARLASQRLERRDNAGEEQTPTRVEKTIETLDKAFAYLKSLSDALTWGGEQTEERVIEILREHQSQISELEQINIENAGFQLDDWSISSVQHSIDRITHGIITRQLPGVKSDVSDTESVNYGQFVDLFRDPQALLFMFPLRNLRRIRTFAQTLGNILRGQYNGDTLQKTIKNLRDFGSLSNRSDKPVLRQVWRLQDLSGGGGLGFTVELFFLAFKQLLSESSSKESHSALYIGTFHAITSDWGKHKSSHGTQKLLLDLVAPHRGIIFGFDYPDHIVDEFLALLSNVLDGQTGSHIDDIVQQLTEFPSYLPRHALSIKVLNAIPRTRTSPS